MILEFEYTNNLGAGSSPQVLHMMDNGFRVVYLNSNNEVINIIPFENDLNKIKISELDSIISLIELTKIYYDRMEL